MKTKYIADDTEAIAARLKEIEQEKLAALNAPAEEPQPVVTYAYEGDCG